MWLMHCQQAFASEDACFAFLQELVDTGECELFAIAKAVKPDTSITTITTQ